jgi:hypothetical protein
MTTPCAIVNPHDAKKKPAWPFLLQIRNTEAFTGKVDQVPSLVHALTSLATEL